MIISSRAEPPICRFSNNKGKQIMDQIISFLISLGMFILCGWALLYHPENPAIHAVAFIGILCFGSVILYQVMRLSDF